jgi:hypothetical protein
MQALRQAGRRAGRQLLDAITDDGTFGLPQSMSVDVSVLAAGVGDRQGPSMHTTLNSSCRTTWAPQRQQYWA